MNIFTIVPPTQPSLTGSPVGALAVELMWERPIGEINHYVITYSPVNDPSMENNETVMDTVMSTVVGNLSPDTPYRFTLRAVSDAYGSSLPSAPVTVRTQPQSSKHIVVICTYDSMYPCCDMYSSKQ